MNINTKRKPGEAAFALILSLLSLVAVWFAYGIAGFEALSSPGAFPMAVAAVMTVSSLIVAVQTLRTPLDDAIKFSRDVLPPTAAIITLFILLYAIALRPLGFLPTSLVFLFASILMLARRGVVYSAIVSVLSLVLIYVVFRLVFSVLMPEGIVPEREILAFLRSLFGGGKS